MATATVDPGRPASSRLVPLWIVLAALLATSPLLFHGSSCGHDLSFHLLNWMEVASQWKHGIVRPLWCFPAAWNAGEPRFVFYPPLSWTLGASLSLVLPLAMVPAAYIFVALSLCGLTMHLVLRDLVSAPAAMLVSCIYLANPYALFTAFERSAFAELLAAAWMPLLLRAVLKRRCSVVALALPVALLWLTNAPAAVAGSYGLLIAGTIRCVQAWRQERWGGALAFAGRMVAGYTLGLGFASFFLLPAIVQRRMVQVQMAVLPGLRPLDNFIFTRTGQQDHDVVLHQASLIAIGILGIGLACFALLLWKRSRHTTWRSMHDRQASSGARLPSNSVAMPLGLLLLAILFLLTRASNVVWKFAPELSFLQFPWRFLAVGTAVVAVLLALLLPRMVPPKLSIAAGLSIALLAGCAARPLYFQTCDDEDTPSNQRALFQQHAGAEPTDEYTPAAADNDALRSGLPEAWTAHSEDDSPRADNMVRGSGTGDGMQRQFTVPAAPGINFLVVRLRQFYGWHVALDARPVAVHSQRDDGLLAIPLTPGQHHVAVWYAWTWDEFLGLVISLSTAAGALIGIRTRIMHRRDRPVAA